MTDTSSTVITGIGLSACLGNDASTVWSRVCRGECGIGAMSAMESPLPPGKDGGQSPDLPAEFEPNLPREARYLRWTIEAALRSANIDLTAGRAAFPYPPGRVALMLGTTLHGMRAGGAFLRSDDATSLGTFLAGDTVRLATRGLGIGGLSATTCSACSSSLGAVAMADTLLSLGEADLVIAGGYDTISEYAWAGFNALRLISDPPLRPFARGRSGMKVAEGYGIVILERRADANRRNAAVIATIAGWGESADAFHLTRPQPEGAGALRAMRDAVSRAGIEPAKLDLVAAHATGTPDNDASEAGAITALLGDQLPKTGVVGFKSHLGHTLGGAGAAELILSALALSEGIIPPNANIATTEVEYAGLSIGDTARKAPLQYSLNTSLGFGGANTCVVLSRGEEDRAVTSPMPARRAAVITGVGVLVPGAIGNEAFVARCAEASPAVPSKRTIDDVEFEHLINARRTRRMSSYVKLSLCAATLACKHAGIADDLSLLRPASAILGTTHGSAAFSYDYYAQIIREGVTAANPVLFAEGVPNAAAAQLSLMLGLEGACQTIVGTTTAGVEALALASLRIASGVTDRVIVCVAEEPHFTLDRAYERCEANGPTQSCAAAVAFVVESAQAAEARGAPSLATLGRPHFIRDDHATSAALLRRAVDEPDRLPSLHRLSLGLPGQTFSVEPLLSLASLLLTPTSGSRRLIALDRSGLASTVEVELP